MQKSLSNYWSYIDTFYLRKPSAQQIQRLSSMRALIESDLQNSPSQSLFDPNDLQSHQVLKGEYFKRLGNVQSQNLLNHIDISQILLNSRFRNKKNWKKIEKMMREKEELVPTSRKNYNGLLREEKEKLKEFQVEIKQQGFEYEDSIADEINKLTEQLKQFNFENKKGLTDLENKVREQIKSNKVIYIINPLRDNLNNLIEDYRETKQIKRGRGRGRKKVNLQQRPTQPEQLSNVPSISYDITNSKYRMQIQLRFIQYAYTDIQRKILAESMCKITGIVPTKGGVNKNRNQNNVKFIVQFDSALQFQPLIITKKELYKLNSLKQLSLLKFYRVSGKCLYGNICQNIAGFTHIYKHLKQPNVLKNATPEQMIQKLIVQPPHPPAAKLFAKFQMCHNCQQLYKQDYLVSCNYRSIKPKYDPQNLYAPKQKDIYSIKDGAFCCDRKYCHHCLNNSYANRKKNGLCPFCQEICYCTRCQKQNILTRFKGIYQTAGGDVSKLENLSILNPMKRKEDDDDLIKKRLQNGEETYEINSLESIKDQLQEYREICKLIQKRERQKLKLVQFKRELFERNLDFFKENLNLKRDFEFGENEKEVDAQKRHWNNRKKMKKIK